MENPRFALTNFHPFVMVVQPLDHGVPTGGNQLAVLQVQHVQKLEDLGENV